MADQLNLYAVALGGALTLAGTAVSQLFGLLSGHIQRRHDRDVRQRERLERLADAVGASLPWFQAIGRCRSYADIALVAPSPAARQASMLADLYFPSIVPAATDYINAAIAFHDLAIRSLDSDSSEAVVTKMVIVAGSDPDAQRVLDEVVSLRIALDAAIAKEAKKYLHT